MSRTPRLISCTLFLLACRALAGNGPENAQRDVEENYLPKLNLACGVTLAISWDAASLKKHNKDIRQDQTGGGNECNEPLRYAWYLCKTPEGRAALKKAELLRVVCRGVEGPTGSLTMSGSTITVGRAFEEPKPFERSRKQFEAIFKTRLPLTSDDPYYDEEWNGLKFKPNPVTDTKTWCLVNGSKVEWNQYASDTFERRKQDATVKCWKDGELVTQLSLKKGVKSGFSTHFRDAVATRTTWLDGKRNGEDKVTDNGKVTELALFANGTEVSRRELYPPSAGPAQGKLKRYSRKYPDHIDDIDLAEDGKVLGVSCSPQSGDDKELRKWCGFEGQVTHQVYDGTGKVARVVTFKGGVLQKQGPGTSDYGSGSEVSYKDGKKHGEERVVDKTGKLRATISWDRGEKDGKELEFADDGKRVLTETVWKQGELTERTERYLNGNPKLREVYESPKKQQRQQFWDTGKVSAEGTLLRCEGRGYRAWCEDGVHTTSFESGEKSGETTWKAGKRHGAARSWFAGGQLAELEEFADGACTKRQRWELDGGLALDEEYEADGSRKLKR